MSRTAFDRISVLNLEVGQKWLRNVYKKYFSGLFRVMPLWGIDAVTIRLSMFLFFLFLFLLLVVTKSNVEY